MVIIVAVVGRLFQYIHNLLFKSCCTAPPRLRKTEESTVNPSWVVSTVLVLVHTVIFDIVLVVAGLLRCAKLTIPA